MLRSPLPVEPSRGVEPDAVVLDRQDGVRALSRTRRTDRVLRLRVAGDVGEGLARQLHDLVRSRRTGRPRAAASTSTSTLIPDLRLDLLPELAQRLVELPVGEDARPQPEDVVAQVADHPVELVDRALDARRGLGRARHQRRALQPHADREQRLDDAVVELLGDALALLHQPEPPQVGLRSPILDRHRGLVGERLDEPDRLLGRNGARP